MLFWVSVESSWQITHREVTCAFYNPSLLGVALSTYAVYFSSKTLDSCSVAGFRFCRNFFLSLQLVLLCMFCSYKLKSCCALFTQQRGGPKKFKAYFHSWVWDIPFILPSSSVFCCDSFYMEKIEFSSVIKKGWFCAQRHMVSQMITNINLLLNHFPLMYKRIKAP